jgi:hypothetical protein
LVLHLGREPQRADRNRRAACLLSIAACMQNRKNATFSFFSALLVCLSNEPVLANDRCSTPQERGVS